MDKPISKLTAADCALLTDPALLAGSVEAVPHKDAAVGQEAAVRALHLADALGPGSGNVFVLGRPGYGRHAITLRVLGDLARRRPTPPELLYVVRFTDLSRPQLLRLPAGIGQRFAAAMRGWTQKLLRAAQAAIVEEGRQTSLTDLANSLLEPLVEEFSPFPEVVCFLEAVRRDLREGVPLGVTAMQEEENLSWAIDTKLLSRYEAHLLVARSPQAGAPVVTAAVVNHALLFGWVECETHDGDRVTHHQLIRPGLLAQADGGFLVVEAEALLADPESYATLMRALAERRAAIEPPPERDRWGGLRLLAPDPVPIAVQLVVIGTPEQYQELAARDEAFPDRFPIVAPLEESMARTVANEQQLAALLVRLSQKQLPIDASAAAAVLDEAARAAPDRQQLSLAVGRWVGLLAQASALAKVQGAPAVTAAHVHAAIDERFTRSGAAWRQILRSIAQGELLIASEGIQIGQINGLVVFDEGGVAYGHPVRITATIRLGGEGELIDIERESELGGALHSKGVMILAAFLAGRFARHRPLPLAASLVMEQSYGLVEGDSASLAEACALLSAIAQIPLDQGVAVTGSINQLGEVQPVGAVNEKIEGWFAVCAARGLTGRQGVILPWANRHQLMLRPSVRAAVAEGAFHLWAVTRVDAAFALLAGKPLTGPQSAMAEVTRALARLVRCHHESDGLWRRPWQRRQEK